MTRAQLESIIEEELKSVLTEMISLGEIAVKKGKPRAGVGKTFKGKPNPIGPNKTQFSSAGTVNNLQGRKIGPKGSPKYKDREEVGKKILNAIRRGGPAGRRLEAGLKTQMAKHGGPIAGSRGMLNRKWTKKDLLYSYAWALASDYIAKGGSPDKFKITKKGKLSSGEEQ